MRTAAAVSDSFVRSGGSPPAQNIQPVTPAPTPLLVDIRMAAQILGTSVWNLRVMCWSPQHRNLLSPVRLGAKYMFAPSKLASFVDALVAGKIRFPASPTKTKAKRRHA